MSEVLRFDVLGRGDASDLERLAGAVDRITDTLKRLDKTKADPKVDVDTRQAERNVGRFAADMQRTISRAVDSLPEIDITADSSDAQREVARIRDELSSLDDQRIGIDIDAADAQRRVAELERELRGLNDVELAVDVRADVATALTQLAAVNGEVDRLDGRTARVTIDVDRGLADTIVRVAALGRALGTLALPAAALATAPTIASIGAAAVTATGALGLIPAAAGAAALGIGALTVGMRGLSDAFDENPGKAAEAIAKLAPAARESVGAIKGLGSAWNALRLDVQQRLFDGLARSISSLGNTYLPILRDGMGQVATSFNQAGREIADMFSDTSRIGDVRVMVGSLAAAWDNLLRSLAPITSALTDIGVVGSGVLRDVTSGAQAAAERFAAFIRTARESGDLTRWMQAGVEQVKQFGRITRDAGVTLYNVFRSAEDAGAGFFDTVERVTASMREWTSSAQGSEVLAGVFRTIRETVEAVRPGIEALGRVLGNVLAALVQNRALQQAGAAFSAFAVAAAPILDVLGALATTVLPPLLGLLADLAPVLVPVAAGLLAIKLATMAWSGMQRFPQWLMSAKEGALGAEQRLTMLGRAVEGVKAPFIASGGALRQFGDEMRVQRALAGMSGQALGRMGAAAAAFQTSQIGAVAAVRGFRDEVTASARAFRDEVTASYRQTSTAVNQFAERAGAAANTASVAFGDRLANAVQRGVDGILNIPTAVREAATSLRSGLVSALNATEATLRALPGQVSAAASSIRTGLVSGVTAAGTALRTLGTTAADAGRSMAAGLSAGVTASVTALRQVPAQVTAASRSIADAARSLATQLGTQATSAGSALASGIRTGVTTSVDAVRAMPAQVATHTAAAGRSISEGIRSGVTAAGEAVRALPSQVATAVSSTASAVATGMRAIPDHIRTAFSSIGGAVDGAIGHFGRFSAAVAGAGTSIGTGLMRAGGSLVSFLGGPWGVALAAAGVALSVLSGNQAAAEEAARKHQQALEGLRGTLDQYSGAVTQATVNERAKQLAQDGSLAKVKELGISTEDYVRASLGEAGALERVRGQLDQNTQSTIAASREYQVLQGPLQAAGITMGDFAAAASGSQEAADRIREAISRLPDSTGRANQSFQQMFSRLMDNSGASAALAESLGITTGELAAIQDEVRLAAEASGLLAQQMGEVKAQIDAVPDAKEITLTSTSPEVIQQLRDLGFEVTQLKDGTVRVNLEDAEARAKFDALMVTLSTTSVAPVLDLNTATATQKADAVKAHIDGLVGIATADANAAPGTAKADGLKTHIDGITGILAIDGNPAPGTQKAADLQAHVNGLVGIMTQDGNNAPGTAKGDALRSYIDGLLGIMEAQANTDPGSQQARDLKAYIDRLRAAITVSSNANEVGISIDHAARGRTSVIRVVYRTEGTPASGGVGVPQQAMGGIMQPMEAGGVVGMARGGRLTKMRGGIGQIVKPNTWRIIGDRLRGDEAYIPINQSRRSHAIFDETARRMGRAVAPMAGGGQVSQRQTSATTRSAAPGGDWRSLSASARGGMSGGANLSALPRALAPLLAAMREFASTSGGGVTFQNTFAVPSMERTADRVAQVQRTQAALGLFGG